MDTDFSTALLNLKNGDQVRRVAWTQGTPDHIEMFGPLHGPAPTENTIMASYSGSQTMGPWNPSVIDICAEDWEVIATN